MTDVEFYIMYLVLVINTSFTMWNLLDVRNKLNDIGYVHINIGECDDD